MSKHDFSGIDALRSQPSKARSCITNVAVFAIKYFVLLRKGNASLDEFDAENFKFFFVAHFPAPALSTQAAGPRPFRVRS